jgi:hypothetical protein
MLQDDNPRFQSLLEQHGVYRTPASDYKDNYRQNPAAQFALFKALLSKLGVDNQSAGARAETFYIGFSIATEFTRLVSWRVGNI